MGKEAACYYLGLSRSAFDTYVREGKIPKGKKHRGLKEKTWKKTDLDRVKLRTTLNILFQRYQKINRILLDIECGSIGNIMVNLKIFKKLYLKECLFGIMETRVITLFLQPEIQKQGIQIG